MAATTRGMTRTPYAAMGRVSIALQRSEPWTLQRFRRLPDACRYVHDLSVAWARLIGGQPPVLYWYVLDLRDFSEWHQGIPLTRGNDNGTQTIEGQHWYRRG
jgi:hypothetical protein